MVDLLKGLLALLLATVPSLVQGQMRVGDKEMLGLPPYCSHAPTFKSQTAEGVAYWRQALGPTFDHIHHYCWALVHIKRGSRFGTPRHEREHSYASAIADIDYILSNGVPGFVLLPEVLTRRGEALAQLNKFQEARSTFEKAIDSKPDYWPPYKALADLYVAQSDTARAKEILRSGIGKVSDPRALQRMSDELGRSK